MLPPMNMVGVFLDANGNERLIAFCYNTKSIVD